MNIGKNILKYMEKNGISREEIKRDLEFDDSAFEDLINSKVSPGVSNLLKIATILKTDIPAILHGKEYKEKKAIKTSSNERLRIEKKGSLNYESLSPMYVGRKMEPFLVTIFKNSSEKTEISQHAGEEFLFITKGKLKINVDGKEYILNEGDSFYFDSSLPHSVNSITEETTLISSIYKGESMVHKTRGKRMKAVIEASRLLGKRNIVVVGPDKTAISAVNLAIEENIVAKAYLVGNINKINQRCGAELKHTANYEMVSVEADDALFEFAASQKGVELIKQKKAHMIMKGKINTASFIKAILEKKKGIGTGRRLSLVGIFEIPGIDRLIMLTDPGINPALFTGDEAKSGIDIIRNAIDVSKSIGVTRPKVALLDANEVPSENIPTTMQEKELSEMDWGDADVYGPLSYDLALYEEYVKKKGIQNNPVAGKADILVVPYIVSGNILYKSWVMTMGAEVANVVLGASAPVILTSRSDSEIAKFLTICTSSLYSSFLSEKEKY